MSNTEIQEGVAKRLIRMGYTILDGGFIKGVRGEYLKLCKKKNGYIQLNIGRGETQETFLVHRLVAEIYVPNPDNLPEVNHDNGIKDCNWSWNLKWSTRPDNIQHGFDTGLITPGWQGKTGNLHIRSKTVYQYDENDNYIKTFGSTREAARITGINDTHIQDVCRGKGKSAGGYIWKYNQ